jgi:multidrug efflux pump subunit AcrB
MALNVSAWSIRYPTPAILFSLVMLLLGWVSFSKLPITRLPNADIPVISAVVVAFGTAPAELEPQVTRPIEDAVAGIEGVHNILSTITDGVSATTIMFSLESNSDRALNDVKNAVTRVRGDLPQNINEPLVQRVEVVGLPIVTYAAISPGKTPEQLSTYVDNVVIPALQGIHGVAEVERIGGVQREILVSLDPDRLEAVGLTAVDVSHQLRGTMMNVAGGRAAIGGQDQAIRTLAGSKSIADLAGTMISLPLGGEVRLDDLGIVTDTIAERTTFARFNGEPIVAVAIKRGKGASDVVVAQAAQKRIYELKSTNPSVDLKPIDSSVEFTRGHYNDAIETLFAGACLAVIVVFLFLRNWRTTLIAAISLPLSIFPAFWVMQLLGFSLNMVSLLAITLSTGVLVDDAIVEVENIERHIRMGKSPYQAAMEAADEIGLAVIAISLTIVAIFAPASFIPGIAGQFFKQFGITVSVLVLFSLLAARFITPMLAAYFLRPSHHAPAPPGRFLRGYTALVTWSVRHYLLTVFLGLALFAASMWSMGFLSKGFLPADDASRSLLAIELPPGSELSDTQRTTGDIVTRLHKRPDVKSVFVDGGRVPPSKTEVRLASLIINYVPKSQRSISQHELELEISRDLANIPDIRSWFLDQNGLRALTLDITGPDSRTVDNVAAELAAQMQQRIPLVSNVITTTSLERPELRVHLRSDLATRLGVSTDSLAETIRVATIGDFGPALAKFDAGDRLVPIRVQLDNTARTDHRVLEQLRVPLPLGRGSVPLTAIADIKLDQGPTTITRFNRQRESTVAADLVDKAALGDALAKINELPVMSSLPQGITARLSGDAESLNDLANGFKTAMIGGLMMVYAVLVLLFGSFLQPITILFSLPLSIGGAIVALLLTGQQLTTPVWIGVLILMGIVTKNAIMLVDFAAESMHLGVQRDLAIIDAGQKRARPIIMTTIAMIAGMTPAALAYGAGGEFRSPMAIAVIGGLIVSTLLSLVFVPAFMAMMDTVGRFIWRFGRLVVSPEKTTVPPYK